MFGEHHAFSSPENARGDHGHPIPPHANTVPRILCLSVYYSQNRSFYHFLSSVSKRDSSSQLTIVAKLDYKL